MEFRLRFQFMWLPNKGKILALDLGTRKSGLAISDDSQTVVFERPEWNYENFDDFLKRLKEFCEIEKVIGLIVGDPKALSGKSSDQTRWARRKAKTIEEKISLPVILIDERWSTVWAGKRIKAGFPLDSAVAAFLLETYLASKAAMPGSMSP